MKKGACPEYYGPGPSKERQRGFPYQSDQTWELIRNLRKLVSQGKMLLCTSATVSINDDLETTPRNLVPKRNPDRAISADMRLISDLRKVDLGFGKSELYLAIAPSIYELLEEILKLKRKKPGLDVVTCKRDIDAALTRVFINPDLIRLISTEFRSTDLNWGDDLICGHLCLPFGWVG